MSFGTSSGMSAAMGEEKGAIPALGQGVSNLQSGANFFNTLLQGNRANTMNLLQPDINRIREATQGSLQAANTLMPRGGGRFTTLFNQPFAAQQQIGNLFSGLRSGAASGLANIGGTQANVGQVAASNLFNQSLAQKQMLNQFLSQIIQGAEQGAGGAAGGYLSKH